MTINAPNRVLICTYVIVLEVITQYFQKLCLDILHADRSVLRTQHRAKDKSSE
uniref:Uncharacterized protein n=1 Tax=Octopus bimaculoides TaxID=37653 RepID=A0A0L8G3Y1_OCTBM